MRKTLTCLGLALSLACTFQSNTRSSVVWMEPTQKTCPEVGRFAGRWKLTTYSDRSDWLAVYDLHVDVDGDNRLRVQVRGPDPDSKGAWRGFAKWGRHCNWIGVDAMMILDAKRERSVEMLFLLSLEGDELRGLFAIHGHPRSATDPEFTIEGGAAAARVRPPEITPEYEGFPCQLRCGLRQTFLFRGVRGFGWGDSNGFEMCMEENECEPSW